ncbi:MAG TPA: S41 family peptidase [Planctomycetota bacterium]|nr:S41 family peptidase [Planctomycetota bacterium]
MDRLKLILVSSLALAACSQKRTSVSETPIAINDDVSSVYAALQTYYLYPQNIPSNPSQFATVSSLVAALNDPFTFTLTPAQAAQSSQGSFQGLFGLSVAPLGTFIYVATIDPSGPAWAAGLRRNDLILSVDGVAFNASMLTTDIETAFSPSTITVSAFRGPNTTLNLTMTKGNFTTTSVEDESLDTRTHYVRIGEFVNASINPNGPSGELAQILQSNQTQTRWVIDLRWDTGGYLSQAAQIADLFISNGLIVTLKDKNGNAFETFNATGQAPYANYSLVVLVNGDSASSSEVLADSLRVLKGVKIVGTQTFGKGVSQRIFQFPDGGELFMVSFRMLDANNFSWAGTGLTPDDVVQLDPIQLQSGVDSQLQAALAQLP